MYRILKLSGIIEYKRKIISEWTVPVFGPDLRMLCDILRALTPQLNF